MERRNNYSEEYNCSQDSKETLIDMLVPAMRFASILMVGMAIGIGLCKFWPDFWYFVNWGIRK